MRTENQITALKRRLKREAALVGLGQLIAERIKDNGPQPIQRLAVDLGEPVKRIALAVTRTRELRRWDCKRPGERATYIRLRREGT